MTEESPFDVVDRVGPVAIFRDGPKPRAAADRHGAIEIDGDRVAVFVQTGRSSPTPDILERGRGLMKVEHPNIARAFFFGAVRNKHHFVVERVGGVALAALVRRVRKRAGTLPAATCARIARDLCAALELMDEKIAQPRFPSRDAVALRLADTVVSWEGRVVLAPRVFGTPADCPRWLERDTINQAVAALLFALLTPTLEGDVDTTLMIRLAAGARLEGTGSAALDALVTESLTPPPSTNRRRRRSPTTSMTKTLDHIVRELGGDDERFAAGLMAELFGNRKRADVAWREEMMASPLP